MELLGGLQGYSREVRDYLDKLDGYTPRLTQPPSMAVRLFRLVDRPYGTNIGRDVDAHMSIRIRHHVDFEERWNKLFSTYPAYVGNIGVRYATWRRTISSNYTYEFIALAVSHIAVIGLGVSVFGRWWTAAKWFSVTGVGAALFGLYNICMYNPRSVTYDLYCAIETLITRIKQSSCDDDKPT